jgi:4-amino-4-deoxy-L-arabinose transferase-like glycosyltransferase
MTTTAKTLAPPRRASSGRQFLVLLMLVAGVQLWIVLGRTQLGERRQIVAAIMAAALAVAAWWVRPWRDAIVRIAERVANPAPRGRLLTAAVLTIVSIAYLYFTARHQHRDFSPMLHDEYCYLIQSKMLASGHLWLPKHELSDFFETFHLITDRAYASKYGPGTAMFYAPAALLHLPMWVMPLMLSGLAVGLMYLLASELFDDSAGLLAALLLLSLGIFRRTSIMVMSQAPMLALALLAILAFVYWRRQRRAGWMILIGACVGWGAITRPVDALCIAIPLALGVLFELRQSCNRGRVKFIGLGLIAVSPFLLLQLIYNKGVTGDFKKLPWNYYAQRYDPYDTMSRGPMDPSFRPMSDLPQVQRFFDEFTLPAYRDKIGRSRLDGLVDRASRTLAGPPLEEQEKARLIYGALPSPLLIALLPLGLLGLCARRRWVVWLALPLFMLVYASYTFFLSHYAVAIAPAVILNLLAGVEVARRTWPGLSQLIGWMLTAVIAALALTALPEVNAARRDQWFDAPLLRGVDKALAGIEHRPAIVLFKYDPERMIHEEPVFNTEAAWPDDAAVIRAHDLGDENARLFAYYAKRSPGRTVYRYDEREETLMYLGTVGELAGAAATTRPASGPAKRG